jgi:hypothetical protein
VSVEIPGVGWALWSKKAGTSNDYSVLGCTPELFSKGDFGKIITRFAGGTPDSRAAGADRLPWVTVSWVGVDAGLRLGIAITDNSGQVDAVGRPITQTSYFCLPYLDVARERLSYTSLYKAASQAPLAPQDGYLITLSVPDEPSDEAARRVTKDFDERIAGSAAALLLRGPVTVTQADGSTLEQRLAFIDAAASLLPFGLRAKLTAGTWSDSGTRHRLRLAFAGRPREDGASVAWRQAGEVTGDDIARDYYDQLRQVRSGTAAHGQRFEVTTVIAHLAASTGQERFEQPQEALATLRLIDLPDRVLAAVRAGGPVDQAELRQVFRLGHFDAMDPAARLDLLMALSDISEADDWPVIEQHLGPFTDAHAAGRVLSSFGWRVLWAAGKPDTEALRKCMAVAEGREIGDRVLAGLVRMRDPDAGPSRGATAAAGLLVATVLSSGAGPGAYPVTRDGLASQPGAVAEYLAALASSAQDAPGGRDAVALLSWLASGLPAVVGRTFDKALGHGQTAVSFQDIAGLAALGAGCVRALLATASATGQLDVVLTAFTRWIASHDRLDPSAPDYWHKHLRPLNAATPRQRAYLDLALMSVGAAPTGLPPARQPDGAEYLGSVVAMWKLLRQSPEASRARCVSSLALYLRKQRWAESRGQAEAVTALAGHLRSGDPENVLIGVVASGLSANPAVARWDFAQAWLAQVRGNDAGAIQKGLLNSLATVAPGTDPVQIATLFRDAQREGIKEDQAFYMLRKSAAIDSPRTAVDVAGALRWEFERSGVERTVREDWLLGFIQRVVRDEFGSEVGQATRDLLSRAARQEIALQLDILYTLAERPGQGELEFTGTEREGLEEMRDIIDLLVKRSAKRPFGGFLGKKTTRGV